MLCVTESREVSQSLCLHRQRYSLLVKLQSRKMYPSALLKLFLYILSSCSFSSLSYFHFLLQTSLRYLLSFIPSSMSLLDLSSLLVLVDPEGEDAQSAFLFLENSRCRRF